MTRCSVCDLPNATAIDDLLNAGVTQKDVAQQFSLSKSAVSRHVRHAKQEPAADDVGQTEIAKWLSRADDQYLLAVANADQRAAVQALIVGLRGIEAKAKSDEREAEASREQGGDMPEITIEQYDRVIARAEAFHASVGSASMLISAVASHIGMELHHRSDALLLDLISQFLSASRADLKLIQDFERFIEKQMVKQTPELALHGEN